MGLVAPQDDCSHRQRPAYFLLEYPFFEQAAICDSLVSRVSLTLVNFFEKCYFHQVSWQSWATMAQMGDNAWLTLCLKPGDMAMETFPGFLYLMLCTYNSVVSLKSQISFLSNNQGTCRGISSQSSYALSTPNARNAGNGSNPYYFDSLFLHISCTEFICLSLGLGTLPTHQLQRVYYIKGNCNSWKLRVGSNNPCTIYACNLI